MRTAIARVIWVGVSVLCASCVATSDPESHGKLSLETRAQQTGRSMTAREGAGLRVIGRRQPAARPTPDRFSEVKPGDAPTGGLATPDTAPGRQLSWLLTVLSGGSTRRLDTAFSESFFRRTPESELRSTLELWRRDEFGDGPAEVHSIEDSALSSITAILRGRVTGRYSRLRLSTDRFGMIGSITLTSLLDYRPGDLAEWASIERRLQDLGGTTSLAAYEITAAGPQPLHRTLAEKPLAIGGLSSFYIAGAIAELVQSGSAQWTEALPIDDGLKSLMGGKLQLEPADTEFPLIQYLTLMLGGGGWNGWGDTTAFDHLFARAGRGTIENYLSRLNSVPDRNRPFLASMEYFRIKLGSDRSLPARFAQASEDGRRALLQSEGPADKSLPSLTAAANWRLPFEVDRIGYFATADDLSRTLAELISTARKPGMEPLARALQMTNALDETGNSRWLGAGVKAGTEPGILSMAWILERHDGRTFTLVLISNDPARPLRHTELTEVASAAVALLRDSGSKR